MFKIIQINYKFLYQCLYNYIYYMQFFSSDEILKLFKKYDKEINKLYCALEECCEKHPINIGSGLGLYKDFYKNHWRFKTLLAGNNITLQDTGNEIVINSTGGSGSFNCDDLLNCSTSNLPEGDNLYFTDQRAVDALTGQNISIFNNDVPYITATEFPLTATQIAFGDGSNLLTSSPNLVFDGNVFQVTTNGGSSGWGQISSVISSSSSEAGLSLYNTGTGGHIYNLISTSNASGIGGGKFSIGDATTSQNIFEYSSSTNEYKLPLLGGSGDVVVFANNTGTLYTGTIPSTSLTDTYVGFGNVANQIAGTSNFIYDTTNFIFNVAFDNPGSYTYLKVDANNSYYSLGDVNGNLSISLGNTVITSLGGTVLNLDRTTNAYSIGANGFDFNTHIFIDDTVNKSISLNATNGVIVSNLSGGATQMVVADNTGLLSKQSIPSGYISSVSNTSTINLTVSAGDLTADFASMNISQFTNDSGYLTSAVTSITAGASISIGGTSTVPIITNTAPDQTVVLNGGSGISVTGTYPNFTIASTSSGGTVTSVAALTIGTTGTDLTSTVANSTTTPVITLNVPTASSTNRGALSSTDWSTFNNKANASGTTNEIAYFSGSSTLSSLTTATYPSLTELSYVKGVTSAIQTQINSKEPAITWVQGDLLYGTGVNTYAKLAKNTTATRYLSNTGSSNNPAWAQIDLTNGVTGTLPVGNGGTGTSTAFTSGSVVFAGTSGVYSQNNAAFYWDNVNNRLGLGLTTPASRLHVQAASAASTRELLVKATVSDAGTDAFYISNATGLDATFAPLFAGMVNSVNSRAGISFDSFVSSGNDASNSGPMMVFRSNRSSSTSDPINGSWTAVVNRDLFQWQGSDSGGNDVVFMNMNASGRLGIGQSTPTAILHLKAGTATASTAPLKLTSGTNLTTAETGAVEYNGTNLFFTRTGTTRETVMTANAVNNVSPTSPNRTITVVIDGTTYYLAAKTTND